MDVVLLSRIQFAFTIAFHYLFPPLSIGLALVIVFCEGWYLKSGDEAYRRMAKFWTKLFALSFGVGVASGLVQVFAFGNNWGRYSSFVGDVFGSVLAAEGIFAFFLEAGFVGLMFFGWERVSKKVHYLATVCVAVGAHFSAIWIVAANSWMQTPAGFQIVGSGENARAVVKNYWEVIFNPSFLDRITHVILGAWLTGAFIVLSISGFYMLKKRHQEFAKKSFFIGQILATIFVMLQLWSADSTARGVAKNQPVKLAAMEGVYKTVPYSPLTLVGYSDQKEQKTYGIKVPALLSLLTYRNAETPVPGLDQFPESDWPNVPSVFQVYHLMIAMWGLMFLVMILNWIFWKRDPEKKRWLLWGNVFSVLFPYIANQSGWFTAEMGRQPWIVYNIMRTSQGVSKSIVSGQVAGSLIMFIVIYSLLGCLFLFLLDRKIRHGPTEEGKVPDDQIYSNPFKQQEGNA